LFSWIKRAFLNHGKQQALTEIRYSKLHLKSGDEEERSVILVSTALAVQHLRTTKFSGMPFPEDALNGDVDLSNHYAVAYLSQYNLFLQEAQEKMANSDRPMAHLVAPGYLILINSIRGLLYPPPMLAEAREMWSELCRGMPFYIETYRQFVNQNEDESVIWGKLFLPAFFVPKKFLEAFG